MKNNGDAFVLLISHSGGSSFVLFFYCGPCRQMKVANVCAKNGRKVDEEKRKKQWLEQSDEVIAAGGWARKKISLSL